MTNWRVSEAAAMAFDHGDFGYGFNVINENGRYGFNVINENGRPIVTFVYDENDDAKEAAAASFRPTVRRDATLSSPALVAVTCRPTAPHRLLLEFCNDVRIRMTAITGFEINPVLCPQLSDAGHQQAFGQACPYNHVDSRGLEGLSSCRM